MIRHVRGRVVTPHGTLAGVIGFDHKIREIQHERIEPADVYVLPGFIDTHVHGAMGSDAMEGEASIRKLAQFHLKHGTTTLFPTTRTNPWDKILAALQSIRSVAGSKDPSLPDIPGAHLEGPFISEDRLGAQPRFPLSPTSEQIDQLLDLDVVKLATIAPEIHNAIPSARRLAESGIRISVGHTSATFEQTMSLINEIEAVGGTVGFTHLFNAMGGMEGREPAVVGAALAHATTFAELILDGHHVHRGSFLAVVSAKHGNVHLITDASKAAGWSTGEVESDGRSITLKNGAARLPNGTLAGSLLTLDGALRNAVELGLSIELVSRMLSATPARYMGLSDRGELKLGQRADLVVLDDALRIVEVYVAGRKQVL